MPDLCRKRWPSSPTAARALIESQISILRMIQPATNESSPTRRRLDVGAQQLATVYAQAFLDAVTAAAARAAPFGADLAPADSVRPESVLAELDGFIAEGIDRFPKLEAVLTSALIQPEKKAALLDRVFKGRLSPLLLNFLKVLAHHGRLDILRSVHWAAHKLFDQSRGVVRVAVSSAVALDEPLKIRLTESIRQLVGGTPMLETHVRPELIGGLVMRVGDSVYDGSISTRLNKLRQQMIDRSVHEIQSRRDRFRSPE
jgi:F-type H+-transporting ATPase subunit delta